MSAEPQPPAGSPDHARFHWPLAAHLALVAIAFGVAGFGLSACVGIARSEVLFTELFGDMPLPLATQWVLQYRTVFFLLALFVPCAGLATLALRERMTALGVLAGLILFAALHAFVVWGALQLPLFAL